MEAAGKKKRKSQGDLEAGKKNKKLWVHMDAMGERANKKTPHLSTEHEKKEQLTPTPPHPIYLILSFSSVLLAWKEETNPMSSFFTSLLFFLHYLSPYALQTRKQLSDQSTNDCTSYSGGQGDPAGSPSVCPHDTLRRDPPYHL